VIFKRSSSLNHDQTLSKGWNICATLPIYCLLTKRLWAAVIEGHQSIFRIYRSWDSSDQKTKGCGEMNVPVSSILCPTVSKTAHFSVNWHLGNKQGSDTVFGFQKTFCILQNRASQRNHIWRQNGQECFP